jgi:hypothetical protein
MKRGSHHDPETRRYLSRRVRCFWTAEEREKARARTLRRMAAPDVRERIKSGMRRAADIGVNGKQRRGLLPLAQDY